MDINEIKTYLETNKDNAEVKSFMDSFRVVPTLEVFKSKLQDADFKSFMDSEKDKHLTKGIETFKTNNLQKLLDDKVKELYPEADPKDTELAKMKLMIETMQKENSRKELTNKALKLAQEKKLPVELVDYFIGNDEESTINNLTALETIFSTQVESIVTERLKGGYKPPKDTNPATKNPWSKEYFNLTEQGKLLIENPTLATQYMSQVNQ